MDSLKIINAEITGVDSDTLYTQSGRFIDQASDASTATQTIDCEGLSLIPSMIDLSQWFSQSDYRPAAYPEREQQASIRGGFSSICLAPDHNINTDALGNPDQPSAARQKTIAIGELSVKLEGQTIQDYGTLSRLGTGHVSNGLYNPSNQRLMVSAFKFAKAHSLTVHSYLLDHDTASHGCCHDGMTAARLGLPSIPVLSETLELARILALVEQIGTRVHLKCVSSAAALRMIEQAKKSGLPVTVDTAISHLFLTEHDQIAFDAVCHVLPPLRSSEDRDALLAGIASGLIDAVCSEHQPLNRDAKLAPFPATEPGMSTVDTFLSLGLRLIDDSVIDLQKWTELTSINPARILGIDGNGLNPGAAADFVLFDPNLEWVCGPDQMISASPHCPFHNWTLNGKVVHSYINGHKIF